MIFECSLNDFVVGFTQNDEGHGKKSVNFC